MSIGFAFKQSLHLCSVSNLGIFLVFQVLTLKVGFSGTKTIPALSRNGPLDFIFNSLLMALEDAS